MSFSIILTIAAVLWTASSALANDLYRVRLASSTDATRLRLCNAEGVVRLADGYLVLADSGAAERLAQSGLDAELIASNVSRDQLCLERSRGTGVEDGRRMLFAESGIRISLRRDGAAATSRSMRT